MHLNHTEEKSMKKNESKKEKHIKPTLKQASRQISRANRQ